jgi:hypothetical protein
METHEPVSADEAMVALAAARSSRAQVAWANWPMWYWFATGAGLGAATAGILLPDGWDLAMGGAVVVLLFAVGRAASRARGICEGCVSSAMTLRETFVLYGPATLIAVGSAFAAKAVWWAPIVFAVLVFAVFAGTGLVLGGRATRP